MDNVTGVENTGRGLAEKVGPGRPLAGPASWGVMSWGRDLGVAMMLDKSGTQLAGLRRHGRCVAKFGCERAIEIGCRCYDGAEVAVVRASSLCSSIEFWQGCLARDVT